MHRTALRCIEPQPAVACGCHRLHIRTRNPHTHNWQTRTSPPRPGFRSLANAASIDRLARECLRHCGIR
jgi:hypothetical protein